MFRIADKHFEEDVELKELATFCLTQTIKSYVGRYFIEEDSPEDCSVSHEKINIEKSMKLFDDKLLNNMEEIGVDSKLFISKKIAQFMDILNSKEDLTPDIFIEYILYKMMKKQSSCGIYWTDSIVYNKKGELKKKVREYAKKELEITDVKERNKYVKETVALLTEFPHLLYIDDADYSMAFWDWDFSFFDDWGFEETLSQFGPGLNGQMRGYGLEYMRKIFTDVNEPIPNVLNLKF